MHAFKKIPVYQTVVPDVEVVKLGAPLFAQVELTEACQYGCVFCYNVWKDLNVPYKSKLLSKEQAFQVLDVLIECQIFDLIYSGGEPTLFPYLPELVAKATQNKIETVIISNGVRLDRELLLRLKDAGLAGLQISMHHHMPEMMDQISQRKNSFSKTLAGAITAVEVFKVGRVSVNMVAMKHTVSDVLEMGKFLSQQGLKQFSVGIVTYTGEAALNDLVANKADLQSVYIQLEELAEETGMSVALTGGMPLCIIPERKDPIVEIANVCDAGIHQIVVGPDGSLRPCVASTTVVGNIFTDDLRTVWQNSQELIDIREFKNVPTQCLTCDMVATCHGGCRASALRHTGDPLGLDPLMQ